MSVGVAILSPDVSQGRRVPTRNRRIGRQQARPASRKRSRVVPPTEPNLQAPPKVLVVDDDPSFVDFLTQVLSREGMVILAAYSGQQCLEQVRRSADLDVIILDVMMQGMNGLEVRSALQQMGSDHFIPIIFLTAKDDMATRLAAMQLGVSEFLVKPVRNRELVSRIRTQVEESRKVRAREQTLDSLESDPKKIK